jgi:hypothetical protein
MRAEVRMKIGHSFLAKYRETHAVIDLDGLFNDYWSSSNDKFTVLSELLSPMNPHISDREGQRALSLEIMVVL